MDRETLQQTTGLTTSQRDQLILKYHKQGWSQRKIGTKLGMTQAGVSHAIKRLTGQQRIRTENKPCACCWEILPTTQLTDEICNRCRNGE